MSDGAPERVTCPSCGKGYRWQEQLVGRVVPCKLCDAEFTVPDGPGTGIAIDPADDGGTYELDIDAKDEPRQLARPAVGGKCPSCNSPVKDHAVICINCGFNMAQGKQMQKPQVAELDPAERKAGQREAKAPIRGMALVRAGLWLNLISMLLLVLSIPVGIGGLMGGHDFVLIAAGGLFVLSALCGFVGGLLCLAVPRESKARPIAIASITAGIASLTLFILIETGVLSSDLNLVSSILGQVESIGFLWFFVMLASYLEFDEITERAKKLLGLYLTLVVAQMLASLPLWIISCFLGIYIVGTAIYTTILYVGLLIDLSNALGYRIGEQKTD